VHHQRARLGPDGETIAVDAICDDPADNGIWLARVVDGSFTRLIGENAFGAPQSNSVLQYWKPSWSADGSTIYFHRVAPEGSPAAIWAVEVRTGDAEQVIAPLSSYPSAVPASGDE
jgi:Tol biopolymer transport system component